MVKRGTLACQSLIVLKCAHTAFSVFFLHGRKPILRTMVMSHFLLAPQWQEAASKEAAEELARMLLYAYKLAYRPVLEEAQQQVGWGWGRLQKGGHGWLKLQLHGQPI